MSDVCAHEGKCMGIMYCLCLTLFVQGLESVIRPLSAVSFSVLVEVLVTPRALSFKIEAMLGDMVEECAALLS